MQFVYLDTLFDRVVGAGSRAGSLPRGERKMSRPLLEHWSLSACWSMGRWRLRLLRFGCHPVSLSLPSTSFLVVHYWLYPPDLPRAQAIHFCFQTPDCPAQGVGPCEALACLVLQSSFHSAHKQTAFLPCVFGCVD